jgi:hypothetical protein
MALLNSGFVIDDPSEISGVMQQIMRGELGLERTGDFEELEIDLEEEEDDDTTIDDAIPDDEDYGMGEEIEESLDDFNEDL